MESCNLTLTSKITAILTWHAPPQWHVLGLKMRNGMLASNHKVELHTNTSSAQCQHEALQLTSVMSRAFPEDKLWTCGDGTTESVQQTKRMTVYNDLELTHHWHTNIHTQTHTRVVDWFHQTGWWDTRCCCPELVPCIFLKHQGKSVGASRPLGATRELTQWEKAQRT